MDHPIQEKFNFTKQSTGALYSTNFWKLTDTNTDIGAKIDII